VSGDLFGLERWDSVLAAEHYLGASGARPREIYQDDHGVIVFAACSSRRLPSGWLELSRWCLRDRRGSEQWAKAARWIAARSETSTIVSYSDPSVGHDGALYRAANWVWAPTWHVLREPPTGAGIRGGKRQRAKHRWVYLIRPDSGRHDVLRLRDESLERRYPWVGYQEPRWKHGRARLAGQDRWRRWARRVAA